jgi:hypothetical protein
MAMDFTICKILNTTREVFTDHDGRFFLRTVKLVDYPIPNDGLVGEILSLLHGDCRRLAQVVSDH